MVGMLKARLMPWLDNVSLLRKQICTINPFDPEPRLWASLMLPAKSPQPCRWRLVDFVSL